MTLVLTKPGKDVFAGYDAAGAARQPDTGEAARWSTELERYISAAFGVTTSVQGGWDASVGTFPGSGTAAKGDMWLVTTAGTVGGVAFRVGDAIIAIATNASTTTYAANWVRVAASLDPVVRATDSGAGTANAIQVTASRPVAGTGGQLIGFSVFEANTSATVTVTITDSAGEEYGPFSVKTAAGNDPAIGALSADLAVWGEIVGSEFRMLSDLASAAIQAAAEAAKVGAEAARDDAAVSAQLADGVPPFPTFTPTLTSGVPLSQGDVAGATRVYLTPFGGNTIKIFDGTNFVPRASAEIAVDLNATNHLVSTNYDLFMAYSGGSVVGGTGPAWDDGASAGSDTARGTGAGSTELEDYQGRLVNKNAITLRNDTTTYSIPARQAVLIGTCRMISAGETEDTAWRRMVSSAYYPQWRKLVKLATTNTWNYTGEAYRNINADANSYIGWVQCLPGRLAEATTHLWGISAAAALVTAKAGVGVGSTSVDSSDVRDFGALTTTVGQSIKASYCGDPGIGFRFFYPLEAGHSSNAITFFGDGGVTTLQTGITGKVFN